MSKDCQHTSWQACSIS
ncbi:MAG: hypothetical protein ACRCXW_04990, partial [Plesiomonas shigelloides]